MDIRFIDSRYKELFRIPDGGCIKINLNNGGTLLGKCKYIDDYHFTLTQVGRMYGETYHIRQFAEINERNGNTAEPVNISGSRMYSLRIVTARSSQPISFSRPAVVLQRSTTIRMLMQVDNLCTQKYQRRT